MYAKTANFSASQQELAKFAKLLSHPARIAILEYLAKEDRCISGDISGELPLSRTTVSQHLKELKDAGLIKGEIEGQTVCYCIEAKTYRRMQQLFERYFRKMTEYHAGKCC